VGGRNSGSSSDNCGHHTNTGRGLQAPSCKSSTSILPPR